MFSQCLCGRANDVPGRRHTHGTESYDAIIVGGGHNGLVAAAYLARSGAKTLVLEARGQTGGAATTEAPWPDAPEFKVTRLSYVMSLLPPTIMNDLKLERHGYKIFPMGPYYQAFPEGGSLTLYEEDSQRAYDEIARWSKKDADAYPKWNAWLGGLADVLGPLLLTVPPGSARASRATSPPRCGSPGGTAASTCATIADVTRLMTMSIADLLDDWFIAPDQGRARGQRRDRHLGRPVRAGHRLRDGAPLDRRRRRRPPRQLGLPRGRHGRGRRRDRQLRRSRSASRSGPAPGSPRSPSPPAPAAPPASSSTAARRSGRTSSSPRCTRRPRSSTTSAGRTCRPTSRRDIEHWKTRSGVVKINLALGELPDFTANPGTSLQEHHTGSVEMAPSMEYIERAFIDAREGRPAVRPFSDGVIPTAFDKTLSPEGTHIMSLFTQWVPSDWSEEPHREELEKYADRVIDTYNEVAPNFKAAILHRDVVGPYEMEHDYGLIGGNIFHGELSLEQLFHMRPAPGFADYRTPVARPVLREPRHPRRRRRLRHPRHAGGQGRDRRPRRPPRRG